jgi:glycosyltransferase involved in cell wall biosynthesis
MEIVLKMDAPRISVFMIAYNHEHFIAQAIEGILMQKVTFPFELVIGEDCSADGTRAVAQRYAGKFPGIIRLLPSEKNLGMQANTHRTLLACRGEFLAFCEGDDFWTDPYKLATQIDFMERNPGCSICFHNYNILIQRESEWRSEYPFYTDEGLSRNNESHALKPPAVQHPSMLMSSGALLLHTCMVRNLFRNGLPSYSMDIVCLDWIMNILASRGGDIRYIDKVMGTYRWHPGGIWSAASRKNRHDALLKTACVIRKNMALSFKEQIMLDVFILNRYSDAASNPELCDKPVSMSGMMIIRENMRLHFFAALGLWSVKSIMPKRFTDACFSWRRRLFSRKVLS